MLDQRIGDPSNPRDDGTNGPVSRKEDARRRDPSLDPTAAAAAELVSPAIAKPVIAESQAIESGQAQSGPAGQSPARTVSKTSSPGEPRARVAAPTQAQAPKAPDAPSAPQAAQAGAAQAATERGARGGKAQESTPAKAQRSAGMPQNQAGSSPTRVSGAPVAQRLAGPGGAPSGGSARIAGLNLKSLESKLAPKADRPQPRFKLEPEDEKVAAQFGRGLAAALRQNGGSVTIRLQPEALGDLKIKMSLDSGKVGASFEVQTDQARQLLGKSMDTLKSALEARGLEVGRLDVQVADHGHATDIAVGQHAGGASADPGSGGGSGSEHPEPRTARTAWMPRETAEPAEQSGPWMGSGTGGALRIRLDALA
jgi:flagellar hook-length control protein FliK